MREDIPSAASGLSRARDLLAGLPLARAVQLSLGATIVLVVFGSSSLTELVRIGSPLRWLGLAVFAGLAVLWAVVEAEGAWRLAPVAVPAALLAAFALVSTAWSVAPRLTFERGGTLAVALVAAWAVAAAVRGRRETLALVAEAIVVPVALVCLAGAVLYAFDPSAAASAADVGTGFRFEGLGENPDTVQMLAAIAAFPAAWLAVDARGLRRAVFAGAAVVFCAHVVASGSRGGTLAIAAGALGFAIVAGGRRRPAAIGTAVVLSAVLIGGIVAIGRLTALSAPAPAPPPVTAPATGAGATAPAAGARAATVPYPRYVLPPLDRELGSKGLVHRSFFGNDGRGGALQEAFDQGAQRPVVGWGFGTESTVFINRLARFRSSRAENSYLGLFLQLGVPGVLLWLAVGVAALWYGLARSRRLERRDVLAVGGLVAMVAAGYVLGVGQSYVYSVGNVATLSFWLAVFLLVSFVGPPRGFARRRVSAAALAALVVLLLLVPVGRWESAHARTVQTDGIARVWQQVGGKLDGAGLDGFRRADPLRCLLYAAGTDPTAFELCFEDGHLVEAIDRRGGRFQAWTVQPFGPAAATIVVPSGAVDARLRALGAFAPAVAAGPGYLARPIP